MKNRNQQLLQFPCPFPYNQYNPIETNYLNVCIAILQLLAVDEKSGPQVIGITNLRDFQRYQKALFA